MKLLNVALLPTLVTGIVLPQGLDLEKQYPLSENAKDVSEDEQTCLAAWLSLTPEDAISTAYNDAVHTLPDSDGNIINALGGFTPDLGDQLQQAIGQGQDGALPTGGHHDFPDYTIYQLISLSNYTKKFAKLVDKHPKVVDVLNSTKSHYTLFVPVDEAFEHIPDKHRKPSKEFIEDLLLYHVGLGKYPARRILHTHTLPTAYDEKYLDDEPQRLRTSVGFGGVRVNFYSKVIAADIGAKNGIIHGVRSILVQPPATGRVLTLFPSKFSTLLLAMEKTGFVDFIHKEKFLGSTTFAPSNTAFSLLGPRANAFLFNTEKGLKYLKAILKYHVAPNATLYSDAFYDKTHEKESKFDALGREHFDLTTLLDDAHVGVDIGTLGGLVSMRVNGFAHATITDGLAKNGVIQVLDRVLIPPHKHRHDHDRPQDSEDISVEELQERLEEYL